MAETKIPNMIVDFGNGSRVFFVYDEIVYKGTSKHHHPEFTAKIVELSGNVWTTEIANNYINQLPVYQYFEAIDILRNAGKTLEEAVEFLK